MRVGVGGRVGGRFGSFGSGVDMGSDGRGVVG